MILRRVLATFAAAATLLPAACVQRADPTVGPGVDWAYPRADSSPLPTVPPGQHRVPGSPLVFSQAQLNSTQDIVDWFPSEHPAPPAVVQHKRPGGPDPCAECHFPSGVGFLGAADIAGLPADYIAQQIKAFRSGERQTAEKGRPDQADMVDVAKAVSDEELKVAAAYYSALPRRAHYRVVETATVLASHPTHWGWRELTPGAPPEPIGARVIEVAEDFDEMVLSDPHVKIIDYAPPGSVARGAALVKSGGAGGQACGSCHGSDLLGHDGVPALAGRSAAYLARQLWDIRTGARHGPSVARMQGPAQGLSEAQITDISVYLASLAP